MKLFDRTRNLMIGLSALHAVWLLILSYALLNWHFVHWDEGELIQFGPLLKKLVFEIEEKPPRDELMFINVSYDNSLVEFVDEETFVMGNERITDRQKLAEFLDMLSASNQHKLVLLDIRFDLQSEDDAVLQKALDKTEKLLVSNHLTNGRPDSMIVNAPSGISDYPVVGGSFFKFRYMYDDQVKSIPLLMDEIINDKQYVKGSFFLQEGSKRYFNIFLPDLAIRPFDVFTSEDHYFYANLGEILFYDEETLAEITKDKIIVLGDFEKYDSHETLIGDMPGALILINSYYTLKRGLNKLNWLTILYVFAGYFVISLIIFIPGDPLEYWLKRISGSSKVASALAGIFSYFLILILMVLTTYFLFDFLLNVLWLTFYLYFIDKLVTWIYKKTGMIKKGDPIAEIPGVK